MRMVSENDRLPGIVQEFLRHADTLQKLVQKATWEIAEDIRSMLYARESKILMYPICAKPCSSEPSCQVARQ